MTATDVLAIIGAVTGVIGSITGIFALFLDWRSYRRDQPHLREPCRVNSPLFTTRTPPVGSG